MRSERVPIVWPKLAWSTLMLWGISRAELGNSTRNSYTLVGSLTYLLFPS
ncbi:hypothetical protein CEXT_4341, partial [Caerostris extrusa]